MAVTLAKLKEQSQRGAERLHDATAELRETDHHVTTLLSDMQSMQLRVDDRLGAAA